MPSTPRAAAAVPPSRRPSPGDRAPLAAAALGFLLAAGGMAFGPFTGAARAQQGFGEIVRAFCLSAFESEMEQAGKVPPAGMADYACGCMAGRLRGGSSVDTARAVCRKETAMRYPI